MIKRLILVLSLFISINSLYAQNNYATINDNLKWTINIGSWIPTGHLARTFNPCVNFEFQFGIPFLDVFRFDIYVDAVFAANPKYTMRYFLPDTMINISPDFIGHLGLRLSRIVDLNKGFVFDYFGGIGYSDIMTSTQKINSNEKNDTYDLGSITFNLGFNFGKIISNNKVIGIKAVYIFSPYYLNESAEPSFGSQSFEIGLYIRLQKYRTKSRTGTG